MNFKLSVGAVLLLRHTLGYNGEKEIGQDGQEVASPRRLGGVESSQRRHLYKNTEGIAKGYDEKINGLKADFIHFRDQLKEKLKAENKINENENADAYEMRIGNMVIREKEFENKFKEFNAGIVAASKDMASDFELNDKTVEVVKKYYTEFGEKVGFSAGDDDSVDEINKALSIE